MVWALIITSYMFMHRNYLQTTMVEAGGAKSELRGTDTKHNLQTIMEALVSTSYIIEYEFHVASMIWCRHKSSKHVQF